MYLVVFILTRKTTTLFLVVSYRDKNVLFTFMKVSVWFKIRGLLVMVGNIKHAFNFFFSHTAKLYYIFRTIVCIFIQAYVCPSTNGPT